MSEFSKADLRDIAKAEVMAETVLRQCEFLRRNGPTDRMRFDLIAYAAWGAWRAGARGMRRYDKSRQETPFHWHLPRGYGS